MKNKSTIVFSGNPEELAAFAKALDENGYRVDPEKSFSLPSEHTRSIVAYGEGEGYEYGYYRLSADGLGGEHYPKTLEEALSYLN